MPCNVCPSKNAETVAFLSLAELDRCTLRQKHSDCAEDWFTCELCVRQARPNPFLGVNVQSVCYFNQYYYCCCYYCYCYCYCNKFSYYYCHACCTSETSETFAQSKETKDIEDHHSG